MARRSDAKANALLATEHLVRRQGAAATGLAQIIQESGAPKGSFYFHFPGGKEQLLLEMLEAYSDKVLALIHQAAGSATLDAPGLVLSLCNGIAAEMAATDYRLGCALQALTDEFGGSDSPVGRAAATHSRRWIAALAQALAERDMPSAEAEPFAVSLLAGLQGARSLAKALQSRSPFDALARLATRC